MLPENLTPVQTRVLGALIEKELSTPDHYPLSLNALTAACNQSSNRDPVMTLAESEVSGAIDTLRRASLVRSFQSSGSRVPKYSHLLADAADLSRSELAVLCVLTLRGPQTLAEVKTRAARLAAGDDTDGIEPAIEGMIARTPTPLVTRLPRRPGQKELRYAHLLGGPVVDDMEDAPSPARGPSGDRIALLEETVSELRRELADLRAELADFRKQFE
jgi:uncharacterized protein YceH (UPF0502 family)